MKFHLGFENTGVYEEGFGLPAINAILIFSAAGVTLAGLVNWFGWSAKLRSLVCLYQASAMMAIFYVCISANGGAGEGEGDVEIEFKQVRVLTCKDTLCNL